MRNLKQIGPDSECRNEGVESCEPSNDEEDCGEDWPCDSKLAELEFDANVSALHKEAQCFQAKK